MKAILCPWLYSMVSVEKQTFPPTAVPGSPLESNKVNSHSHGKNIQQRPKEARIFFLGQTLGHDAGPSDWMRVGQSTTAATEKNPNKTPTVPQLCVLAYFFICLFIKILV